jgi:iron complex outermembrane receptor protein
MRKLNRIFHSRPSGPVMFLLCALLAAGPAWPQEPGDQGTDKSGREAADAAQEPDIEVVVTANRTETEVTKIPASVTVITGEELRAEGKETVVEVLEELAGVSFRNTRGNPACAEISMRGFGDNSFGRVLILLDGRRLNQPDMAAINWLQVHIENIERIEVVRGGNSVLYGDYAVGGVINIITKKGGRQAQADMFASAGGFQDNQQRLGVSGMLGPFDLVVHAEHTATLGYRDHSALKSMGAGFELGTDISDSFHCSLNTSYEWLSSELPGGLTDSQMDQDPTQSLAVYANDATENHTLNNMASLQALFGGWGELHTDLYYNLKVMKDDIDSFANYTDKYLHSFGAAPRLKAWFPVLGKDNRVILGTDLAWDIYDFNGYDDIDRHNLARHLIITKGSYGFYLLDEYSLLDNLNISAGIRYELNRVAVDTIVGTDIDNEKYHNALVWDAGIAWEFIPRSKLYGRYETVFRYPFIDEQINFQGFGPDSFNSDLEPERGYNLESGLDLALFKDLLNIRINLFFLEMRDEIAWGVTGNENLDNTRHMGAEAEIRLNIMDFIILEGNYTYTYAVFTNGANKDKRIPLVPEHDAFAELVIKLPLGFSLGPSLHYVGESYQGGDYDNSKPLVSDHLLLNAFLRYAPEGIPGKLQFMFLAGNILNQHFATVYWDTYYPEPGLNWKISVSYNLEL